MRRIIAILTMILTLAFSSSIAEHYVPPERENDPNEQMFVLVDEIHIVQSVKVYIFFDKATDVMYMISRNGDIQIMLDKNNNPVLYSEVYK